MILFGTKIPSFVFFWSFSKPFLQREEKGVSRGHDEIHFGSRFLGPRFAVRLGWLPSYALPRFVVVAVVG